MQDFGTGQFGKRSSIQHQQERSAFARLQRHRENDAVIFRHSYPRDEDRLVWAAVLLPPELGDALPHAHFYELVSKAPCP